MGQLILPPDYPAPLIGPLIFLAGPIQGAPDWQTEATRQIHALDSRIIVASPRRTNALIAGDFPEATYAEQVDWETHYLRQAGRRGVVLFWLAKQVIEHPGRAYAQTTRFELGEWKERTMRDASCLTVGIEEGFTNARYIQRRLSQDCPKVKVHTTLKDTVYQAVLLASRWISA